MPARVAGAVGSPGSSRQEGQLLSLMATAAVLRTASSSAGPGGWTRWAGASSEAGICMCVLEIVLQVPSVNLLGAPPPQGSVCAGLSAQVCLRARQEDGVQMMGEEEAPPWRRGVI